MKWWDGAFHTERGLVCVKHQVLFIKSPPTYAYRCPVCAGLAMAGIKRMWDADAARSRRRDGYRRVKTNRLRITR